MFSRMSKWMIVGLAGLLAAFASPAFAATGQQSAPRGVADAPSGAGGPMAAALAQAMTSGKAVPIPSMTSQTSSTVALPDGKFQMTTYVMPVRVRQRGQWVPVSATLDRV